MDTMFQALYSGIPSLESAVANAGGAVSIASNFMGGSSLVGRNGMVLGQSIDTGFGNGMLLDHTGSTVGFTRTDASGNTVLVDGAGNEVSAVQDSALGEQLVVDNSVVGTLQEQAGGGADFTSPDGEVLASLQEVPGGSVGVDAGPIFDEKALMPGAPEMGPLGDFNGGFDFGEIGSFEGMAEVGAVELDLSFLDALDGLDFDF